MSIVEWNDSFLLGINEFDEHHRRLVWLLNLTFDGITMNAPRDELRGVLKELAEYAAYHFSAEEEWMKLQGYPGLAEHVREHESYTKKIRELACDFDSGKGGIDMALLNFLTDWLVQHILEKDAEYGAYVAAKGLPGGVI